MKIENKAFAGTLSEQLRLHAVDVSALINKALDSRGTRKNEWLAKGDVPYSRKSVYLWLGSKPERMPLGFVWAAMKSLGFTSDEKRELVETLFKE